MLTEDDIYAGLVARGLPPHVAAGIIPNLIDESGLNPGINEAAPIVPGSLGGYGLAQWTGPRRNALEEYAQGQGVPVSDPQMQLDFLVSELQGPERRAYEALLATDTPEEAAAAFATDFLRPAKQHLDRRVADYMGGDVYQPGNALTQFAGMSPEMLDLAQQPQRPAPPQLPYIDPSLFMSRRRA